MSLRITPASCARATQLLEHADELGVRLHDLGVREERVRDRLEQGPVGLLVANHLVHELEQRGPGIGRLEQRPTAGRGLTHLLADDRGDQVLL
jgi:hypothetical protein